MSKSSRHQRHLRTLQKLVNSPYQLIHVLMYPFGDKIDASDIAVTRTGYLFMRHSNVLNDTMSPWMTDPANWLSKAHRNSQPQFTIEDKATGCMKKFMGWKALADFVGNL